MIRGWYFTHTKGYALAWSRATFVLCREERHQRSRRWARSNERVAFYVIQSTTQNSTNILALAQPIPWYAISSSRFTAASRAHFLEESTQPKQNPSLLLTHNSKELVVVGKRPSFVALSMASCDRSFLSYRREWYAMTPGKQEIMYRLGLASL